MIKYSAKSEKKIICVTFVTLKTDSKAFTKIKISDKKRYFCTFSACSIQNVSNPMQTAVIWTKTKSKTLVYFFLYMTKNGVFWAETVFARFSP